MSAAGKWRRELRISVEEAVAPLRWWDLGWCGGRKGGALPRWRVSCDAACLPGAVVHRRAVRQAEAPVRVPFP